MDATEQVDDQEPIVAEQAETGGLEDHRFDTFEAALDALEDEVNPEEEPAAEESEADEELEGDDVKVRLDDGEEIPLSELKAGYFRAKDYTHKTTEVAQERKALETTRAELTERTQVVETVLQNLSGYLQSLIPPEPPLSLAKTNVGEYQYQLAVRQNAITELGQLMTLKGAVDETKASVSAADLRDYQDKERAALVKAMPQLSDPAKRAAFDSANLKTAKEFGFSDDEIGATHDNRILRLVHYARIGMRAEENRKNAALRVETPKTAKPVKASPPPNVANRKAMHRLSQTGNWKDALAVDFE